MMTAEIKGPPQRDVESNWARPVDKLKVSAAGAGINLNVDGRQLSSPLRGFGQMWQKTYRIRLEGASVDPQDLVKAWKENFPQFWPEGNRFYGRVGGMQPGDVALLNLAGPGGVQGPGGMPLISTGVMVIYADEESFSFMTPEGHMFAGMITFSAYQESGTVAQVQALIRANDPLYEISFRLGLGHKMEDAFWQQTLENLAAFFGASGSVTQQNVLVDARLQWSQAGNLWHNAAIRTGIYLALAPVRWVKGIFKRET
jgi:hypothetical protein